MVRENTYWDGKGKYQEVADRLNKEMPDMGGTQDEYLNAFIALSKIYYDVYNNGGMNLLGDVWDRGKIDNSYESLEVLQDENIVTMRMDTQEKTLYKNFMNLDKLEKTMDEFLEYMKDKEVKVTKYFAYVYNDKEEIVLSEGNVDKSYNMVCTFSKKSDRRDWVEHKSKSWGYIVREL